MNDYPLVALGRLLHKSQEWITLQPEAEYTEVTVRMWGNGVIPRRRVSGAEIAAARRLVVHENQFILSRIDARHGASGLVPESLNGAIVSNDFPVFDVDLRQLLPSFLQWVSKTNTFVELCKAASEGTTNRVRLDEEQFLACEIPLPPLEDQRRLVAQIDALATQIEEARGFRRSALEEAENILDQETKAIFENLDAEPIPLKLLATKIGSGSTPSGGQASYPETGIPFVRSQNVRMRYFQWEGIAFIDEATHNAMKGTQLRRNDVLLNITGASIGRVACVPQDMLEGNLNQHVAIIRPIETLTPRYLMYWLSQPTIQQFINNEQKGATRQGFTKAQIERFRVPVPNSPTQRQIVVRLDVLQSQLDALRSLQRESAAELDALLPSILDRAFRGEL